MLSAGRSYFRWGAGAVQQHRGHEELEQRGLAPFEGFAHFQEAASQAGRRTDVGPNEPAWKRRAGDLPPREWLGPGSPSEDHDLRYEDRQIDGGRERRSHRGRAGGFTAACSGACNGGGAVATAGCKCQEKLFRGSFQRNEPSFQDVAGYRQRRRRWIAARPSRYRRLADPPRWTRKSRSSTGSWGTQPGRSSGTPPTVGG